MSKNRNKKYNPQKLQTMRNQGKVSRSVPLTALTPQQVALKIRAKQIIKQNSFPAIRDQREGCEFAGYMKMSLGQRDTVEDAIYHTTYAGDWAYYSTTILGREYTKSIKRLGIKKGDPVERNFRITIHLVDYDNPKNKAVETFTHDKPLDAFEMAKLLYKLATDMAAQYPDVKVDYSLSYAVVRA